MTRRRSPAVRHIDPRQYLPYLSHLTDEQVAAWQADPRCLCGCGTPCRQVTGSGSVPYGAFSPFVGNHWREAAADYLAEWNARGAERRRSGWVRTGVIFDLLLEWKHSAPGRSYIGFARQSGVSPKTIKGITAGTLQYCHPLTAARIFVALDEPLRPELKEVYRRWERAGRPARFAGLGRSRSARRPSARRVDVDVVPRQPHREAARLEPEGDQASGVSVSQ